MKVFSLLLLATLAISVHCEDEGDDVSTTTPSTTAAPLDLKIKAQFVTNFKNIWHTIFTQAKIVRWNAYANELAPLLSEKLTFQPCHTVVRKEPYGLPYFVDKHVMGMKKTITELTSLTTKMMPTAKGADTSFRFQFKVSATYVSYTGHFHSIEMVIDATREKVEDPFHIIEITETCPSNN